MAETIRIEIPIETVDETAAGLASAIQGMKKLEKAMDSIGKSYEQTEKKVSGFDTSQEKTQKRLAQWAKEKYEVLLEAKEKVSPIMEKVGRSLKGFAGKTWDVAIKAKDLATAPIKGILDLLKNPLLQAGAVLGIGFGVSDAVNTYKDFEAAMSQVQAVSGATGTDLEKLTQKAKEMGAETKFTAEESAEAFNYMAMAGWKTEAMLGGIEGIMNLAAASGEELATTSDIVTDALTAFGMTAKESGHFADILAAASSNANTNVSMMGETFKYVAPVAGTFGFSAEDTALAIGLMANSGIKASQAGTSLRSALTRLVKPTDEMQSTMVELGLAVQQVEHVVDNSKIDKLQGKIADRTASMEKAQISYNSAVAKYGADSAQAQKSAISLETAQRKLAQTSGDLSAAQAGSNKVVGIQNLLLTDGNGKMKSFYDVMVQLRKSFTGMTQEQQAQAAATLFGQEAMSGMLAVINASEQDFQKLAGAIKECDGAAGEMAGIRLDNLQGSITLLQSALDGVKISFGERLSPYVKGLAEWLTEQMPEIQTALDGMMDWVDVKVEQLRNKIGEMTEGEDWQNADFLGKVKIAWDELIAEPFSQWWNETGKLMIAEKAGDIGNAVGTGISTSLFMLLGIDVSDSVDEGANIGKSFARGFAEGFDFDAVQSKFMGGFSNLVKNARKLLPGGESAGLSSVISAVVLAKAAKPVVSVGKGAFDVGKMLFGKGTRSAMSTLAGSFSLDAELAGTGMASGSGIMGMLGNIGMGLGSSAGTGAGMAAVGGGAVVGGAIAGATLISGFSDIKTALDKNTDAQKSRAYAASGGMKVGGVAAGAAAGAAIGSVVPVLGTAAGALIGAGIGGVAGWIGGNKEKGKYEEQIKKQMELEKEAALEAEKSYAATGRAVKNVRFEKEALNAALKDSGVSAEKFAVMYREAVSEKVRSGFGSISLSLKEIKNMADSIVLAGKPVEQLTMFSEASAQAEQTLGSFQGAYSTMSKINWKAGLGIELDSGDIEEYKSAADGMMQTAKEYIENKHFEASAAVQLLLGDSDTSGIASGIDSIYNKLQGEIASARSKLNVEMEIALRDGMITIDEQAEIQNLMDQIKAVTDKVSNAETNAAFDTMKIKYGGANMDAESFAQLQQQIQNEVESLTGTYDEALKVGITNLNLELSEGVINQNEFDEQMKALAEAYDAQIDGLEVRVENFQLETIASAFAADLDGILPDLEGSTAEKLSQAIQNAVDSGVNPATWDTETAAKFLGLEGLDTAAQDAIIPFVTAVAETMPGKMREAVSNSGISSALAEAISVGSSAMDAAVEALAGSFNGANLSPLDTANNDIAKYVDEGLNKGFVDTGSNAGIFIPGNIGKSVGAHAADTHAGVDIVKNELDKYVKTTIGEMNISANPTMTVNWNVINNMPEITATGSGKMGVSVGGKAAGGIINGMQLSWVGEEGPEAIIPLVPGRRGRALELYRETGKMLGVTAHADGGFVGNMAYAVPGGGDAAENGVSAAPQPVSAGMVVPNINVNVDLSPDINITQEQGQDPEKIMDIIMGCIGELADKVGGDMAEKLAAIFSNMTMEA